MLKYGNTCTKQARMNEKRRNPSLIKKTAITACIGLTFTFSTVYAAENGEGDLETVYHVYVNGQHIGTTNSKAIIEDTVDLKLKASEKEFDQLTLAIGQDVSFVPEKVFNPVYNNETIASVLKDELSITAEAVEVQIDGKTVGYFKDRETAEEALRTYKLKYVKEKELGAIEAETNRESDSNEATRSNPATLSAGDSITTDIALSETVSFAEKKVLPKEIITEEQGAKLLEKGTLEERKHKVKKGEVLGEIAGNYDLSIKKLLDLNPKLDEDSLLQIDQEINVTEDKPFVDVIVKKEEKTAEKIAYETEVIESDDLYKGEKKVKQKGKNGKREVLYAVELKNGKEASREIIDKKVTKEPVKEIVIKGTKVIPSRGSGTFVWPTNGGYVSSGVGVRWGSLHKGLDIARPANFTIKAADNGTVVSAGWDNGGYGNMIIIDHNNGMRTVYAHMASVSVRAGQTVEKGSSIGVMGSTGDSTGVHLHFEVYKNGALQNPEKYL